MAVVDFELTLGIRNETQLRPFFRRQPPRYIERDGRKYELRGYNPEHDDKFLGGLLYFVDAEYERIV